MPVLEARDGIVRIANEDNVAGRVTSCPARIRMTPPLMGPQVVDVVEVDVRKQRRYHRSLRSSLLAFDPHSIFEHAHLQPFLD